MQFIGTAAVTVHWAPFRCCNTLHFILYRCSGFLWSLQSGWDSYRPHSKTQGKGHGHTAPVKPKPSQKEGIWRRISSLCNKAGSVSWGWSEKQAWMMFVILALSVVLWPQSAPPVTASSAHLCSRSPLALMRILQPLLLTTFLSSRKTINYPQLPPLPILLSSSPSPSFFLSLPF